MKIEDLRELTNEELLVRRRESKGDLLNLRIQQASGQLENSARIRQVRRGIARMETILSERRNATATEVSAAADPAATADA